MENRTNQGPLVVYTIVERQRDKRKLWVRIGTAFRNRDGSLNATLDAVPTNGTLHIRELRLRTVPGDGDAVERDVRDLEPAMAPELDLVG